MLPEKQEVKELTDKEKIQQTKEILKKNFSFKEHPDTLIKQLDEMMIKRKDNPKVDPDKLDNLYLQVTMALGMDTHLPVIHAVHTEYRPLAIELTNSLLKEFNVQTTSEKALVHTIVTSYVRVMVLSRQLTDTLRLGTTTPNLNGFYTAVSKDLDRAHRQLTSAFTLLRDIQSPSLNINIKTNNAFVAQNQQLNNTPYENNNP